MLEQTARKALGFEDLLAGDVEATKRRTRNYARRQLTWMRKLAGVNELDISDRSADDVAAEPLHTVLAGDPWIHVIKKDQTFRIVDLEGNQAADTLFFSAARSAYHCC